MRLQSSVVSRMPNVPSGSNGKFWRAANFLRECRLLGDSSNAKNFIYFFAPFIRICLLGKEIQDSGVTDSQITKRQRHESVFLIERTAYDVQNAELLCTVVISRILGQFFNYVVCILRFPPGS